MHPALVSTGEPAGWQAMTGLAATARTGTPAFAAQQGQGFYEYLADHAGAAENFGAFMTSRSLQIAEVIAGLDFSGFRTVADIGGGHGIVLAEILAAHPHLRGILFDQPHVLAGAPGGLGVGEVRGRCELVAGDYLAGPVPPADVYVLSSILHNHDDHDAWIILHNICAAAGPAARLVIADVVLPPHPAPHIGFDLDVRMMALGTGRERTRPAWQQLLASAGFAAGDIIGTPYGLSIIDAHPAPGTDD